jgi:uncharacterized protein (TIGR03790 family)
MPIIADVVEQERWFTMRLKKPFVAFVAMSIVHSSLGLGPLVAQPAAGSAGGAARDTTGGQRLGEVSVSTVVVVKNLNSADSVAIADYYARKRKVPVENVCAVRMADVEECSYKEYEEQLQGPLKQFLMKLNHSIDYIVLTKGLPIRIHEGIGGGLSVDSLVVAMDKPEVPGFPGGVEPGDRANPYFGVAERFRHARWGIYLVTRLIGYTRADCLRLIDNSLAAKWRDGLFLLHTGPGHNDEAFRTINDGMRRANEILTSRQLTSILSTGDEFPGDHKDLMGYYSWGSNDLKFKKRAYNSLGFAPGGIAETAVSTSARTFADPKAPWQSLIADLVAQGATGCKGYVSEPGIMAMAHADILFDRYTAGFNLAESFYSSSWRIHCKDIVIGDPICAPYSNDQAAQNRQQ